MKYVLLCSLLISSGAFAGANAVKGGKVTIIGGSQDGIGASRVYPSAGYGNARVSEQKVGIISKNANANPIWMRHSGFVSLFPVGYLDRADKHKIQGLWAEFNSLGKDAFVSKYAAVRADFLRADLLSVSKAKLVE